VVQSGNPFVVILIVLTAVGSGIVSGAFFAFSTFAMRGIRTLDTPAAIRAMQSVNVAAVRPPLMIALFGTGLLSIVVIIVGLTGLGRPAGWPLLLAGLLYLIGNPVLTIIYNVPRNTMLAAADPDALDAAAVWDRYVREWVPANTVRTITAALAVALLIIALAV